MKYLAEVSHRRQGKSYSAPKQMFWVSGSNPNVAASRAVLEYKRHFIPRGIRVESWEIKLTRGGTI